MQRDDLSTVQLAAEVLAVPRADPADSFVLHASLELLARAGLLAHVDGAASEGARERIRWLAIEFERSGDPVHAPAAVEPEPARLVAALHAGDLDEVDAQAVALASVASPRELRALLAPVVLSSLAAAAHGSILLHLQQAVDPSGRLPPGLLRQALRELARYPTWQLHWFEDPEEPAMTRALGDVLLDVPRLGLPGSDFIYPIMHQAEDSGVAPALLRGVVADPASAERDLSRVAAWSMLQEPDDHVPYGWTHCLTMPQAAVRLADVDVRAVQVAATYVVGFRAAQSMTELHPDASVGPASRPGELAAYAAAHEDAHLAKYTLAALHAADRDPEQHELYLAAATRLAHWWQARDTTTRPA
jgi:hypothetical protein